MQYRPQDSYSINKSLIDYDGRQEIAEEAREHATRRPTTFDGGRVAASSGARSAHPPPPFGRSRPASRVRMAHRRLSSRGARRARVKGSARRLRARGGAPISESRASSGMTLLNRYGSFKAAGDFDGTSASGRRVSSGRRAARSRGGARPRAAASRRRRGGPRRAAPAAA